MQDENSFPVIIIGSGPAGLSLGYELKKRNISFIILEKGDIAANSWHQMPTNLKMLSIWLSNRLPGTPLKLSQYYLQHKREDFAAYLTNYAANWQLPVHLDCEVKDVARIDDGYQLKTLNGMTFSCKHLVNASGYYSNPFIPGFDGQDKTSIQQIHVAEYRDPANVRKLISKSSGSVLIVGKRITAGQLLLELVESGFDVSISSRSELQFSRPIPGAGFYIAPVFLQVENLLVKLLPEKTGDTYPPMRGGKTREYVEAGKVKCYPNIQGFGESTVEFVDGQRASFDLVIYATGYRPTIQHLDQFTGKLDSKGIPEMDNFESRENRNLYFLGLDKQRTFRSRYLRGIVEDSKVLAQILHDRIKS